MYKVIKDEGRGESIFLVNTETSGTLNLGKMSYKIMEILKEDGYDIVSTRTTDTEILTKDKWDLKISDTVKAKLVEMAMPMKKPIRKKVDKQPPQKKEKKIVDALDIIYGLV